MNIMNDYGIKYLQKMIQSHLKQLNLALIMLYDNVLMICGNIQEFTFFHIVISSPIEEADMCHISATFVSC